MTLAEASISLCLHPIPSISRRLFPLLFEYELMRRPISLCWHEATLISARQLLINEIRDRKESERLVARIEIKFHFGKVSPSLSGGFPCLINA